MEVVKKIFSKIEYQDMVKCDTIDEFQKYAAGIRMSWCGGFLIVIGANSLGQYFDDCIAKGIMSLTSICYFKQPEFINGVSFSGIAHTVIDGSNIEMIKSIAEHIKTLEDSKN